MTPKEIYARAVAGGMQRRARGNLRKGKGRINANRRPNKKWIQTTERQVNHDVPAGTFLKKAEEIVRVMLRLTNGDVGHAIKKIVYYINRAGGNPPNLAELRKAIKILQGRNK